jgi:hypothetical protein
VNGTWNVPTTLLFVGNPRDSLLASNALPRSHCVEIVAKLTTQDIQQMNIR